MSQVSSDTPQDRPLAKPQDAVQRDRPRDTPQARDNTEPPPAAGRRPEWATVLWSWTVVAAVVVVAVLLGVAVVAILSSSAGHFPGPAIK